MSHQIAAPDWTVLARYLAGECGPEEAAALRRWLAEDPTRGELLDVLGRRGRSPEPAPPVDVEAALRRVRSRFAEPEHPVRSEWRWPAVAFRLAAAVALVIGASLLWMSVRGRQSGRPLSASYSTAAGQTRAIHLADGTEVTLGPGSRLAVPPGYGGPDRMVTLEGQALFTVRHDPDHPFAVRAGATVIRDLGTRFSVRSDPEGVRVSVLSGSVLLADTVPRPRTVPLKAGESGMLAREQQQPPRRASASPDELEWTRGRLVFDNASLARVRDDLHRWYGLTLVVADSALLNRHLTAAFSGESPAQVLDVIALALGAQVERRGDTAVVRARGSRPATP